MNHHWFFCVRRFLDFLAILERPQFSKTLFPFVIPIPYSLLRWLAALPRKWGWPPVWGLLVRWESWAGSQPLLLEGFKATTCHPSQYNFCASFWMHAWYNICSKTFETQHAKVNWTFSILNCRLPGWKWGCADSKDLVNKLNRSWHIYSNLEHFV